MAHDFFRGLREPASVDTCHREPIRRPDAIQPHGVLLVYEPGGELVSASTSVDQLGHAVDDLVSRGTARPLFARDADADAVGALVQTPSPGAPVAVQLAGARWSATRSDAADSPYRIVELEPAPPTPLRDDIGPAGTRLRRATSLSALLRRSATTVQRLTGYDRVMIYRFDADDHGEVLAEAVSERAPVRFLGRHFPAADIPRQARELYVDQRVRLIVDMGYTPSPLFPSIAGGVDLSGAALRSVSPIHVQYMQGMGVTGTLTLSLVVDGELWGLIACHHLSPRYLPRADRAGLVLLAETVAGRIDELTDARHREELRALREAITPWRRALAADLDLDDAVAAGIAPLARAMSADGVWVRYGDHELVYGSVPAAEARRALDETVADLCDDGVFASHHRDDPVEGLLPDDDDTAGVLAARSADGRQALWLFRQEWAHERIWGNRKDKQIELVDGQPRLSLEGSFQEWTELVRGTARPFSRAQRQVAREAARMLQEATQRSSDDDVAKMRDLTEAQGELLATVSHELRSPLSAVLGWARLLASGRVPEGSRDRAVQAIVRNALAQQRLVDDLTDLARLEEGKLAIEPRRIDLADVAEAAAETVRPSYHDAGLQLVLDTGVAPCPVWGDPQRLQQVLWNFLGNARRVSHEGTQVIVRVRAASEAAVVEVVDQGPGLTAAEQHLVFERFRQLGRHRRGLGLGLAIARGIAQLHDGEVGVRSGGRGQGATFWLTVPLHVGRTDG